MFSGYTIIDNALDNPQELIEFSKSLKYFSSEDVNTFDIPMQTSDMKKPAGGWSGCRSLMLDKLNYDLFSKTMDQIFNKLFKKLGFVECQYTVEAYLHYLPESFVQDPLKFHRDYETLFSGIIYLNDPPPTDAGTIIKINQKDVIIENKFNRMVFYNAMLVHAPQNSAGKTFDTSRLTLTFFVRALDVRRSANFTVVD